jgi:hypothetical protein
VAAVLAAAGDERELLAAVLEDYHARTPAPVDLDRVAALAAAPAFAPAFGEVLRAAWTREGMLRRVLIDRLVTELGLRPAARDRLDERLHEVEAGRHPARQVSRRLLGALDRILPGVGPALAATGESDSAGWDRAVGGAPAFARLSDERHYGRALREAMPPPAEFPEVDELFQAD